MSYNIYFTALVDTAAWRAELATALAGSGERGHIFGVEPTGPFEDDPNMTNKRLPGNITVLPHPLSAARRSSRRRHAAMVMVVRPV